MQEKEKLVEKIVVYVTPEEKERLTEFMLKKSYEVSLSTFIRKFLMENLFKK
jgi:hypothetical protein